MLVSVIIPALNAEDVIENALISLKHQTYSNIEILIVLDGCTDNTLEVCNKCKLQDNRIRIIELEHQGLYGARCDGVSNANGEYIMFLDADDYLEEKTVETLVDVVNRTKSDLVKYRYEVILDGGIKQLQDEYFPNVAEITIEKKDFKQKVYPMFFDGFMLNAAWTDFIKKSLYPKKINRNLVFAEDLLMNVTLFNSINNVTFINEPLYKYCFIGESIIRSKDAKKWLKYLEDAVFVYMYLYDFANKWGYDEKMLSKLRENIIGNISCIIDKINDEGNDYTNEIEQILFNNKEYLQILKKERK